MIKLFQKLDYQIPSWQIKKRIEVSMTNDMKSVEFKGVDSNGSPYELFKQINVIGLSDAPKKFPSDLQKKQPFKKKLPDGDRPEFFDVRLSFFEHYGEPDLTIKIEMNQLLIDTKQEYLMVFDAANTGKWEIVLMYDGQKNLVGPAEFK